MEPGPVCGSQVSVDGFASTASLLGVESLRPVARSVLIARMHPTAMPPKKKNGKAFFPCGGGKR